jgi:hypothetical protein
MLARVVRGASKAYVLVTVMGSLPSPRSPKRNQEAPLPPCGASSFFTERAQFFTVVDRLTTSWALFKSSRLTDVRWCHPKLTVVVKHLAGSKMLRHATVRGFAQH